MKKIALLGSTGSIGTSTLEVIRRFPKDFEVFGISAHSNTDLLKKQISEFKPKVVVITDQEKFNNFKESHDRLKYELLLGSEGLQKLCTNEKVDLVVNALVGAVGLLPSLKTLESGKNLAMANKEALVMAGELLTDIARRKNVQIFPIDSEHSALKQCLLSGERKEVKRLILTASGGPFYRRQLKDFKKITVKEALSHPTWRMGSKISIDSATLMNKGLEVIEAHCLFGIPAHRIEVLIHPQSIVHSMVEYVDGSIIGQMSYPDMKLPIQYALFYPHRFPVKFKELDLSEVGSLSFDRVDKNKFPCAGLAYLALKREGTAPAVLNAANEVAVEAFLNHKIGFLDIAKLISCVLNSHKVKRRPSLVEIMNADRWAREESSRIIGTE